MRWEQCTWWHAFAPKIPAVLSSERLLEADGRQNAQTGSQPWILRWRISNRGGGGGGKSRTKAAGLHSGPDWAILLLTPTNLLIGIFRPQHLSADFLIKRWVDIWSADGLCTYHLKHCLRDFVRSCGGPGSTDMIEFQISARTHSNQKRSIMILLMKEFTHCIVPQFSANFCLLIAPIYIFVTNMISTIYHCS